MRNLVTLESQMASVGKEIGTSDWILVDQAMINKFADVTQDDQFIHIDPVRAASEGPFGTTIAHGFLTVSLLSQFAYQVVPGIIGMTSVLNYGFDKLRFMSPVKSGKRVRAKFTLADLKMRGEKHVQRTMNVVVEIEGEEKPALIADWVGIVVLG
jgi:acyl dehydratase